MGAVVWGALASAAVLSLVAVVVWRRQPNRTLRSHSLVVDLAGAEAEAGNVDREFDRIVGRLLLTDPTFADTASRLARHDDNGSAL